MKTASKLQQTIFSNGKYFFESVINDITAAKQSIDLESYIFAGDSLGEKIANALIDASQRGVKVRVLVDGAGTPSWGGNLTKKMERAGIQTRIFHPFPWRLWHWSRSHVHTPFILKAIYLLLKVNSRNHRKICVVDKRIAYAGSFNISKVHLSKSDGGSGWHDTGVKITGADLQPLISAFNAAWNHIPIQERMQNIFRQIELDPIIRLNNTRHRRRLLYKNLLQRISHCKKRIWMTNAYFIPDNILLKKLKHAAQRGVDVRMVLPQKSDLFFMPWASHTFYQSLLKAGVRIFEYFPTVLHTKVLILDDWMCVGSSNLNHRSLFHDLEIDINIRTPAAKKTIENQFLQDVAAAHEIEATDWQKPPFYQRFFGRLLLYLKYWM
jgi:cardiolipin synthase